MEEIKSLIRKLRKSIIVNIIVAVILVFASVELKTNPISYIFAPLVIVNAVLILKRDKEIKKWGYIVAIVISAFAIIRAGICTINEVDRLERTEILYKITTVSESLKKTKEEPKVEEKSYEERKKEIEEKAKEEAKKKFEVSGVEVKKDTFSVYATGIVKNNTDEEISYLKVEIPVYDKEGNRVGKAWTNFTKLKAGETWKFKASYYGSEKNVDVRISELEVSENA